MSPAPWFLPLSVATNPNPGWERSVNAGAVYGAPGTINLPVGQINGGTVGQDRFRQQFVIPVVPAGSVLRITVSGDIYDNQTNQPAQVVFDGVNYGNVSTAPPNLPGQGQNAGPETFTFPATVGPHVFELWIGTGILPGNTIPLVTADIVIPIPCGCCPSNVGCFRNAAGSVWSCRTPDGVTHWYDSDGNEVAASGVVPCTQTAPIPLVITDLALFGAAFNDAPNEFLCNLSAAPTAVVGFTPTGVCFDPTVASPNMNWNTQPLSSIELEYGSAAGNSGGALVEFRHGATVITWPVNLVNMTVGQMRTSNPILGGGYATLTYVSGPTGGNAPRMEAPSLGLTGVIGLHRATTSIVAPVRFRLNLYA